MIGRIISHYRIAQRLGEGGMSVVHNTQDTKFERAVVLGSALRADLACRSKMIAVMTALSRREVLLALATPAAGMAAEARWHAFRGPAGRGVADERPLPTAWDVASGEGILWRSPVPGLGHSSPIVWNERIFLPTAVRSHGEAPLLLGRDLARRRDAAEDVEQSWMVLAYDRASGEEVWRKTARKGMPRAARHLKATHANTSLSTDGERLVAFFGSEGLYCYDFDGNLLWERDFGVVNISKYGIGWGYASSPTIHRNRIAVLCDDPDRTFIAILRLSDGEELWRRSRRGVSERSWGAPLIHSSAERTQVVANGWPWIVSYDLETGDEIWRLPGGGDNPIPTPFVAGGLIYLTNSHGGKSPIYVVRPDEARGELTPESSAIVWSVDRGGSYISTPVVYGDYIYLGNTNGVLRCFQALTGELIYEQRLEAGASIYSSLVAGDGKIYCASEEGTVYVLKAGPNFEILARNPLGAPCFGTPAIADGKLYYRTTRSLIAVG